MKISNLLLATSIATIPTLANEISAKTTKVAIQNIAKQRSTAIIQSKSLSATLNPDYPSIKSYTFNSKTIKVAPIAAEKQVILIDGKVCPVEISFLPINNNKAVYDIAAKDNSVRIFLSCEIVENVATWTVEKVIESKNTVIKHIAFPGLNLLTAEKDNEVALANFPYGSYASNNPKDLDYIGNLSNLKYSPRKLKAKDGTTTDIEVVSNGVNEFRIDEEKCFGASYAFIVNNGIAAGIYTNVMHEDKRTLCNLTEEGTLNITSGTLSWREAPPAIIDQKPTIKVIFAKDQNNDKKITWEDAAIAFRKATPTPYGAEIAAQYPISYIAMNFGSQATYPFLRVLDNAKKVWLYTDGMGQKIQYKGFAGEGHDSSHPDYAGNVGRRQGGRDELNFAMRRGHDFNILSGVHINAHEYHAEAKEFKPSLVGLDVDPKDFKPEMLDKLRKAWCWLDESYPTDYYKDAASGEVAARLGRLRDDLPYLDFIYLDVYYGRGWPGYNMHKSTNDLGIVQFTEFPGVMERATVWNHVAHDWTQAIWGKGDQSGIARFIYNSQKDTFAHTPLLRGGNCDGFMGWHGEYNFLNTIASAFTVNLPTKYLQNFELLNLSADKATFSNGVTSKTTIQKDGKLKAEIFNKEGQLVNSCIYDIVIKDDKNTTQIYPLPWAPTVRYQRSRPTDNVCFIPWNPIKEDKIYHWNDNGGATTWKLPKSWGNTSSVVLYKLTDLGRVFQENLPVKKGKVTLTNIEAKTPYVIYQKPQTNTPKMIWGEGSLVKDPGFDSHSFEVWQPSNGAAVIENDKYGQTQLTFKGEGYVQQKITGLTPGQVYAFSAWTTIEGKQKSTIIVSQEHVNIAKDVEATVLPNYTDQSAKYKRPWHRLKVIFTATKSYAYICLSAGTRSNNSIVRFDDVRIVKSGISKPTQPIDGELVLFEDFENVDEAWGPFMYGWQGPMNTHLSEANPPYTDDTIQGKFSLKTRNERPTGGKGVIYRTVPATLKLLPNTTYTITFDYKSRTSAGIYSVIFGSDTTGKNQLVAIPDSNWEVKTFTTKFTTDDNGDWYFGVYKNEVKGEIDNLVIDNITVTTPNR